jgi:rubrerythrin
MDLVAMLRAAYSGELAAAEAYRGHWRASRDPEERARIREIEGEERHHRELVGEMLRALGASPDAGADVRALILGRCFGALCRIAGWFLPMYVAGRLESRNVAQYAEMAELARPSHPEMADRLLDMSRVEAEHERYFRSRVEGHPWTRIFPVWRPEKV